MNALRKLSKYLRVRRFHPAVCSAVCYVFCSERVLFRFIRNIFCQQHRNTCWRAERTGGRRMLIWCRAVCGWALGDLLEDSWSTSCASFMTTAGSAARTETWVVQLLVCVRPVAPSWVQQLQQQLWRHRHPDNCGRRQRLNESTRSSSQLSDKLGTHTSHVLWLCGSSYYCSRTKKQTWKI